MACPMSHAVSTAPPKPHKLFFSPPADLRPPRLAKDDTPAHRPGPAAAAAALSAAAKRQGGKQGGAARAKRGRTPKQQLPFSLEGAAPPQLEVAVPATAAARSPGSAPCGRWGHSVVLVQGQRAGPTAVMFGGQGQGGELCRDALWLLDTAAGAWSEPACAATPASRMGHACAVDEVVPLFRPPIPPTSPLHSTGGRGGERRAKGGREEGGGDGGVFSFCVASSPPHPVGCLLTFDLLLVPLPLASG